ncbi:hypothetical protein B0O99DRAFT_695557 [Bisporella sp. PMI_857]|nr:hypothetical protein B0O99DRAFT_695557 [Bisporella sp. PMI_857]
MPLNLEGQRLTREAEARKASKRQTKTGGQATAPPRDVRPLIVLDVASKLDFGAEESQIIFERNYKEPVLLNDKEKDQKRTILHELAGETAPSSTSQNWTVDKQKSFLKWILENYHGLLECRDPRSGYTAMHEALENGNDGFVEDILDNLEESNSKKTLEKVLALTTDNQKKTCLHLAVSKQSRCTMRLIAFYEAMSSDKVAMFTSRDIDGKTALHYAVGLGMFFDREDEEEYEGDEDDEQEEASGYEEEEVGEDEEQELGEDRETEDKSMLYTLEFLFEDQANSRFKRGVDLSQSKGPMPNNRTNANATPNGTTNGKPDSPLTCSLVQTKPRASKRPAQWAIDTNKGRLVGFKLTAPEPIWKQGEIVKRLIAADKETLAKWGTQETPSRDVFTPFREREATIDKAVDREWEAKLDELWKAFPKNQQNEQNKAIVETVCSPMLYKERQRVRGEDPILSIIRNFCLHEPTWDRNKVKGCLYSSGKERHLEFSLSGFPRKTISKDYLSRLAKHLSFESVLACVTLPRLTVENPTEVIGDNENHLGGASQAESSSNQIGSTADSNAEGISDLVVVFSWLKDNHVRSVMKVVVIDDGTVSHSDEAIEEALKSFDIEVWDWKKLDICSEVIQKVSKKIQDISLYWSGSNSTLLGWYSDEGFKNRKKFPELRRIWIYHQKGLESTKRKLGYLQTFKAKINESVAIKDAATQTEKVDRPSMSTTTSIANGHQPVDEEDNLSKRNDTPKPQNYAKPEVHTASRRRIDIMEIADSVSQSYMSGFKSASVDAKENIWLESMENVVKFVRTMPVNLANPVKIAIIDDGVDAALDIFDDKIVSGASFSSPFAMDVSLNPYFVSSDQHGTMMADLILRMCPRAKLFVAKLEERYSMNGRRHITPKSAADAVEWAISCEVDIISMSWTIETTNTVDHSEGLKELNSAVTRAFNNNIIMFCATSDQGNSTAIECYPGNWGHCLRVGASTATGEKCAWVHGQSIDLLLPGENIFFDPRDGSPATTHSGSSVATALGSGLAALMLYLQRLHISVNNKTVAQSPIVATNATSGTKPSEAKENIKKMFRFLAGGSYNTHPPYFPESTSLKTLATRDWTSPTDKHEIAKDLAMLFDTQFKKIKAANPNDWTPS